MIEIRSCEGFDEMEACVRLQIETWGYDEGDVTARKTFLLAQKIGGQVLGAFDSEIAAGEPGEQGKALVGFAMSLPGIKRTENGPQPYLHSHMLAVRASHRNRGLGAQLKWEQRREALSRGIKHMEWTFDPLVIPNAFLNIHRLGAVPAPILWISMVYPLLDCRVGSRPTGFWRSGSWIPHEWKQLLLSARQPRNALKNTFWSQPPSNVGRQAKQAVKGPSMYS